MKYLNYLNIPLGRWFNVPVTLHWSWTLLFGFILVSGGLTLATIYAGVFFIVLLHEFGHCIAAQRYGVQAKSILLLPIGGVANMDVPVIPKQELVVALAGPLVNFVLIPLLWALAPHGQVWETLNYVNIVILIFNLIPAFPMDGGRVLRSLLSMMWDNHERATVVAGRVGQVCCLGFVILGIMTGRFMLPLIGIFIAFAAEQEIRAARNQRKLNNLYRVITGNEPPQVSPHDIAASGRMISDIQRRLAAMESREDFEELSERMSEIDVNRNPR